MTRKSTKYAELQNMCRPTRFRVAKKEQPKRIKTRTEFCRVSSLPLLIAAVFITIGLLYPGVIWSQPIAHEPNVLILNSYHRGYYWSDQIMDAIQAEFDRTDIEVELFFEYMDSQRYGLDEAYSYMKELYRSKYHDVKFDVIISSDDNALYFLLDHRNLLFPEVPIVFCGVQEFNDSEPEWYSGMTGVLELYDWESTVKIALKLHPAARQIVAVSERGKEGFAQSTGIMDILPKLDTNVEFAVFSLGSLTMAELLEKLEGLGEESIVLLDSSFKDSEGNRYHLEDSVRMIREHCAVPIYTTGFRRLGLGPVGGKLTSGSYQGQAAAQIAIRVLKGENVENIPVVRESPNVYMFDYEQLQHFGISLSALPEGSIIINQPESFYYHYKRQIWIVTAIVTTLTTIVLLLLVNILRRRKVEKALRHSQELFYAFMDQLPATAFMKDENSRVQYVNSYMIEHFGADKWIDHTAMDYFPSEIAEGVLNHDKKVLAEGSSAREEWVPDKNGKMRCMHTYKFPIHRRGKRPLLGGMAIDITEQKLAEGELRESEQRFRAIFDNATDGILLAEPESKKLYTGNDMICQMLGYRPEEIKNLKIEDIHPKEHLPYVVEQFEKQVAGEATLAKDIPFKRKDGSVFYVDVNSAPIKLTGKTYLMGIFRDTTERKQAEDVLRASESKYRTLLENIPQKVFLKDTNSVYLSCNENYAADLNIKADEIAGKTDYDFFPEELAEKYRADDKKIMELGRTQDIEEKYVQKGQDVVVHTVKTPVKDEQGNTVGILGIFWDITEHKKAQEALDTYREKMARAERLASLGTLSATLAHELNQPLTVIQLSIENSLEKLEGTSCPDTVTEALEDGLKGVSNATSIIDRFRIFARNSLDKTVSRVDLAVTAKRIVKLLAERANREKVALRLKGMNKLPPVYANERDMEQIFFAMTENAIQAADGKKDHQLSISGSEKNGYVELQFSDDCSGIARENLDRIFEPFFTTGNNDQRTGLGLCVVQRVVSACGGKIRVDSRPGKGTTFYITLPIHSDKIV
jgi:PAS domain S-box-containing protein